MQEIKRNHNMKRTIVLSIIVGVFGLLVGACSSEPSTPSYTNFKILSVKITAMPFIDASNSGWDPLDGPDVFLILKLQPGTYW